MLAELELELVRVREPGPPPLSSAPPPSTMVMMRCGQKVVVGVLLAVGSVAVGSVASLGDGRLASGSGDNTIKIWNTIPD